MEKIDLTKLSLADLNNEIARREDAKRAEENRKMADEHFKKYKQRPYCKFVGKAYDSSYANRQTLITINTAGNTGSTYRYEIEVPDSVKRYFENNWTHELQNEFQDIIISIGEWFIDNKIATNPLVTAKMMITAKPRDREERYEIEWHETAIAKLCEFSLDSLNESVKGLYSSTEAKLIKEAINIKKEKKIKTKKPTDLSPELKTIVAISKLKKP